MDDCVLLGLKLPYRCRFLTILVEIFEDELAAIPICIDHEAGSIRSDGLSLGSRGFAVALEVASRVLFYKFQALLALLLIIREPALQLLEIDMS